MNSSRVLDLCPVPPATMLEHPVEGARAWRGGTVAPEQWTVPIPTAAMVEIEALLGILRAHPLPALLLSKEDFDLPACGEMMGKVRSILVDGMGVALLDRLPMDDLTLEEAKAVYWVLGQFIAPEVAQKWDGTMFYDVADTGRKHGYGVRRSWTDVELFFHTDNAFAVAPPDFVSLLCAYPAKTGGISRFCSLYEVHNEMLRRHPALLKRLYEPFYYDRQAEHAPDDPKVARATAFHFDGGRLRARLSVSLIRNGYSLLDEELDAKGAEALEALEEILNDSSLSIEFVVERGQMQYLDNRGFAHFRSKFEDCEDQTRKRHLVRLWYREQGRRFYNG